MKIQEKTRNVMSGYVALVLLPLLTAGIVWMLVRAILATTGCLLNLVQLVLYFVPLFEQPFSLFGILGHEVQRFLQHQTGFAQMLLLHSLLFTAFFQFIADALTAHTELLQAHLLGTELRLEIRDRTVEVSQFTLRLFPLLFHFPQ